jgi:hypothetical protein
MTTLPRARSHRLSATAADLPPEVAAALAAPLAGSPGWVDAEGARWGTLAWGRPEDPPVLLVHGVTSNAGIWWRIGPALAAAGHHVIALDMPRARAHEDVERAAPVRRDGRRSRGVH